MPEESMAEQFVIGACFLSPDAIRFAEEIIRPEDFYRPQLGTAFGLICAMKTAGEPVDPFTVSTKLRELRVNGLDAVALNQMMAATPSAGSAEYYAAQVRDGSIRRALRATAQSLMQHSGEDFTPTAKTVAETLEALKAIRDNAPGDLLQPKKLGEVLSVVEERDWIIPRLMERGDRVVITGYEGLGKTTWIRQLAILSAAGVNPITLDFIDPVRVLVIDVENTESQWRHEVRGMVLQAARHGSVNPAETIDLICSRRLDLTKDKDLGAVHRVIDQCDPQILCIGPIYKLVPHGINSDDEAAPLITALDSIRDRGIGMIMEAHSPKASGQAMRDLSPRGSAALMGWPEFGFGLAPVDGNKEFAQVARWRGDRDAQRDWPTEMQRGGPFPWCSDRIHPETRRRFYGPTPQNATF